MNARKLYTAVVSNKLSSVAKDPFKGNWYSALLSSTDIGLFPIAGSRLDYGAQVHASFEIHQVLPVLPGNNDSADV